MAYLGKSSKPAVGRRARMALALATVYLSTGTTVVVIKVVSQTLSPEWLTTLRLLGAALLIAPLAGWLLASKRARFNRAELGAAILSGLLLFTLGQTGLAWGVSRMPAGVAAVISSTAPLFIVLFSVLFLRQPLSRRQLAGVLLGLAGIAALTWSAPDGEIPLAAVAALLLSSAAWAAGSLYSRQARLPANNWISLTLQLLAGGLLTAPLSWLSGSAAACGDCGLTWQAGLGLAYLIGAAVAAFTAFNWLNQNTSSTVANTFFYVAPVIAMALGAAFLGDSLTVTKALAALVALAGVTLILG